MSANAFSNFESFGNYILLKKLATGGMAEVFLARPATHKGNGRVQVIKRILPHAANDADFIKMFQTEIQVCLGFNHPHTVQIHDFGESNGQPFISMEYIEGKNLKDIIGKFVEKSEMMPIPMALSLISQAASGLSYAHNFVNKVTGEEVRAIHRDISPHNLIVSYDGNLKVIDFGIAKAASSIQDSTRAGTIKGKYAYLSPEQVCGGVLDARVDIFALGIVAWELLTLRRPFFRAGDTEMTILNTISNCDHHVKAPSYYNGAVPPELDQVILKCLRKNPDERYATADEFQAAIRQVMRTFYPNYSYSENATMMQSMFQSEIYRERNEIRALNMNVQLSLSNSFNSGPSSLPLPEATIITNSGASNPYIMQMPQTPTPTPTPKAILVPLAAHPHSQPLPPSPHQIAAQNAIGADMDKRLRGIERMMKEKASTRHYLMFAFYVVSLVVLKLDASYGLFDCLIPQGTIATASAPLEKAQSKLLSNRRGPAKASAKTTHEYQQQQYQKQLQEYQQLQQRYVKEKAERAKKQAARQTVVTQDLAE
jgi:serine/threonine protein kinase